MVRRFHHLVLAAVLLSGSLHAQGAVGVRFSAPAPRMAESIGQAVVTVERTGDSLEAFTVDFETAAETALVGQDFTATSGQLTFTAGQLTAEISVPLLDDAVQEFDEAFTLRLHHLSTATDPGVVASIQVTIADDDVAGEPEIASVRSDETLLDLNSTDYGISADGRYVLFSSQAGNLGAPESHPGSPLYRRDRAAGQTLYLPIPGAANREIRDPFLSADGNVVVCQVTDGTAYRYDCRNATLTTLPANPRGLSADGRYVLLAGGSVYDAETEATAVLFPPATYTVSSAVMSADAGVVAVLATLVGGDGNRRVFVAERTSGAVTEVHGVGGAPANDESTQLTIHPGGRFVAFGSYATNLVAEAGSPNQFFYVYLFDRTTATVERLRRDFTRGSRNPYFLPNGRYLQLSDDDPVTFASSRLAYSLEARAFKEYPGTYNGTIKYYSSDDRFYLLQTQSAILPTDTNEVRDVYVFPNQFFPPTPGTIEFAATAVSTHEGRAAAELTVVRREGDQAGIRVDYRLVGGLATAGEDFAGAGGSVVFGQDEVSKTISIPLLDDTIEEDTESFTVVLENPTGGATLGEASTAEVSLLDDESPATVSFEIDAMTVNESIGDLQLTVRRAGAGASEVAAQVTTAPGSALAGSDYLPLDTTITFAPGESEKTVAVRLVDDLALEPLESFTVNLAPLAEAEPGANSQVTVTIEDSEPSATDRFGHGLRITAIAALSDPMSGVNTNRTFRALVTVTNPSAVPSRAGTLAPFAKASKWTGEVIPTGGTYVTPTALPPDYFYPTIAVPALEPGESVEIEVSGSLPAPPDPGMDWTAYLYLIEPGYGGSVQQDSSGLYFFQETSSYRLSNGNSVVRVLLFPNAGIPDGATGITAPGFTVPPTLASLILTGPSQVREGEMVGFAVSGTLSNGQSAAGLSVQYAASLFTIRSNGRFTGGNVETTTPVTIQATAAYGGVSRTATRQINVIPALPPVVTSPGDRTATVGLAFALNLTAANFPTEFSASGLPPGLKINATTGRITGTPNTAGSFPVTITARNLGGSGTAEFVINIAPPGQLTISLDGQGSVPKAFTGLSQRKVGSIYTVVARPAKGYVFLRWEGDIESDLPTLTFEMTEALDLRAVFIPSPYLERGGTYVGISAAPAGEGTAAQLGAASLKIAATGAFSGRLAYGGKNWAIRGVFNGHGRARFGRTLADTLTLPAGPDRAPLKLSLNVNLSEGETARVLGELRTEADETAASVEAVRSGFHPKLNPLPDGLGSQWSLVFSAPSGTGLPKGHGFLTFRIASNGKVTAAGFLADGTAVKIATLLGDDLSLPLAAPLYRNGGGFGGWLRFSSSRFRLRDAAARLQWIKPPRAKDTLYPIGWPAGLELTPASAPYTVPAPGARIMTELEATDGRASIFLEDGDLSGNLVVPVVIDSRNKAQLSAGAVLQLTFSPRDGTFAGKFFHQTSTEITSRRMFRGLVLPGFSAGYGFFLGPQTAGRAVVQPSSP